MAKGLGAAPVCECSTRKVNRTFTINADKTAIEPLVQEILAFAAEQMPDFEEKHLEIDLALQEALANAVVHGCQGNTSLQIKCWTSYDPGKGLLVVISDPGPGFIPADVPDPMQEANLRFDHGRGVFLINNLMDEVHFQKNGSEIHLLKY